MILVNGEYKKHVEISDRGFQYGDGLFETIAVNNGQAVFLDRHLARLETGCHRLKIPFPGSELLTLEAKTLCQDSDKAVLKLIVTRGSGSRGYRQPDIIQPTRVLSLYPYPSFPASSLATFTCAYEEQGIAARFCNTRLGLNPALAGIKHLNRLEQVLARAEWSDPGVQEGIMLDIADHVIEGTMSNLFYIKNDILYTASLALAGIAGVMRGIIITLTAEHNLSVTEHNFMKEELLSADEVFISNSLIGIWPIKKIGSTHFSVGLKTRQIQTWLDQFKNNN